MKLLGLGDNVFDAYLFRDELYPGGNAANVSVLARRIGAEYTGYLGVLADDPPGRHFLAALREESVEVSRVRIGVGKSACNYIVLDDQRDRAKSFLSTPDAARSGICRRFRCDPHQYPQRYFQRGAGRSIPPGRSVHGFLQ